MAGPYRLELYELDAEALETVHGTAAFRVGPGMPAERLAGDASLASRTREAAPGDRRVDDSGDEDGSAVVAFLDDEERIESIRERAREEARRRADEWDLR